MAIFSKADLFSESSYLIPESEFARGRFMHRLVYLLTLMGFIACNGGGKENFASSDVRIDGAGDNDQIDSLGVQMCAVPDGQQVFVVWYDSRDGSDDIWLNFSQDGGRSWATAPVKVNHGQSNASSPTITCDNNRVFVAWEDDRDGELENHNIYYNYSRDGGMNWQSDDILLDDDEEGRSMSLGPQIALWNSRVYVAWFDSINGAYDIYLAASSDDGETFKDPIRVDSGKAGDAYSAYPQLLVSDGGVVYVAWEDSRDELSDIYFSYSQDYGGSFSNDIRLDGGDAAGANDSFSPQLAAYGEQVYAVWHDDRNGANRDIFFNWSENSGGTWLGSAVRVETDGEGFADSIYPKIVGFDGRAHIAWQDARTNAGYDVHYRTFEGGAFVGEADVRLDVSDGQGYSNSLKPQIAVGEQGLVIAWEDRRFDSGNEGYNDIFYNFSEDLGESFNDADFRVDNVEQGSKYANDLVLTVQKQRMLAVWRDGRRGNSDIFFHGMKVGKEAEYIELEE